MNIIQIAEEIQKKIQEIDLIRKEIKSRGDAKAETITNYEKAITITLIRLENGASFLIDNDTVQNPPKSIMDKLAKGLCWKEKLEMEKAEASYKSLIINLEAVQSQLNGLQSIFRHLDNV